MAEPGLAGLYEAYLEGYVLYALEPEGYPAVIPGEGRVYGVVLVYRDLIAALPRLDVLEGCGLTPPLYRRAQALARPLGPVWVYLYARQERLEQPGAERLAGGLWPS